MRSQRTVPSKIIGGGQEKSSRLFHFEFERTICTCLARSNLCSAKEKVDSVSTIVYTLGMKTSVINVKTDREVKKSAQKVAEELGLSLSTVINAYLRQFVRNKEIHLTTVPHMSAELEEFLGRVEEDIKKKRNFSPAFSSGEEMDRWLNAP